ncbi:hypothetical protein OO014_12480 [Intrasporangium calvum]|uniref:Uncharacterized protein n=1 Tax=Intrasporangium calvum TaxID=53358 RepID=A0ABT5GIP7_9MICO|nr:hypothetical protein [Intrasporangium calvum]MDC5698077.1 hypothetical protein [Intrasporangium calvum]
MTPPTIRTTRTPDRPVTVAELKRAWRSLQSGSTNDQAYAAGPARAVAWRPPRGRLITVLGCGGGVGASTTALALTEATGARCRLIECAPPAASGLAGASTAELGDSGGGWRRGSRDHVLIDRTSRSALTPGDLPIPPESDVDLSIVDVARPAEAVLATECWLRELLVSGEPLLLVTTATMPGLRRLETTLALLADHRDVSHCVVAVLGPRLARWPRPVRHSTGPRTNALEETGRLVAIPCDRRLAVTGPDTAPLPSAVVAAAAATALELMPTADLPSPAAPFSARKGSTPS